MVAVWIPPGVGPAIADPGNEPTVEMDISAWPLALKSGKIMVYHNPKKR